MAVVELKKKEWNAHDLARYEMEKADHNASIAAQKLSERAENNPEIMKALASRFLHTACYEICRSINTEDRTAALRLKAEKDRLSGDSSQSERLKSYVKSIYDFRLPNTNIRLGDATRADLQDWMAHHEDQTSYHMKMYAWAQSIHKKTGRGTVQESLKENTILDLKNQHLG